MAVNTIHTMTQEQLIKTLKSVLDQNELLRRDKEKMGAEIGRFRGGAEGHGLKASESWVDVTETVIVLKGWVEPVWWQL